MASLAVSEDKATRPVEHIEDAIDGDLKLDIISEAAAKGQVSSGYETLTPWETVKTFKVASLVCFLASFSAATDGYQIAMNASIVANTGFVHQFSTQTGKNGQPALSSPVLGSWSAMANVGQVISMVTLPFISTRYGRKVAMYCAWIVLVCSLITESLARKWPAWLVAKLLAGIGMGCLQTTIPTYISEVAPVRIRGALLMGYNFWWVVGSFFAHVALQCLYSEDSTNYLIPVYTQWAQVGLMILIYVFLPESPFWCATQGKDELAKRELRKLNNGVKGYNVEQQYQVLLAAVEYELALATEQRKEQWYAIFLGVNGTRTLASLWTYLTQQFIGLTVFYTFGTYFFQQAGLSNPFRITAITSSINIATMVVVIFLADLTGRRVLACGGSTLCWVATVAIGILGVVPQVKATDYLLVLFACFWYIGLQANGATAWGFIAEISSERLRHYTAGFSAAVGAAIGIAMNELVPYMVNKNQWNWGLKTGWFYAGIGLPFVIGTWLLIPEASGRSAAELDELYERKIKPWRFARTETAIQRVVKASNQV